MPLLLTTFLTSPTHTLNPSCCSPHVPVFSSSSTPRCSGSGLQSSGTFSYPIPVMSKAWIISRNFSKTHLFDKACGQWALYVKRLWGAWKALYQILLLVRLFFVGPVNASYDAQSTEKCTRPVNKCTTAMHFLCGGFSTGSAEHTNKTYCETCKVKLSSGGTTTKCTGPQTLCNT